ncbi:hypothetical protein A2U01_0116457, partial [Trifolium medium]|nr:hypothetical protein [Trifolium medium]
DGLMVLVRTGRVVDGLSVLIRTGLVMVLVPSFPGPI